jgi:hypothetical protein
MSIKYGRNYRKIFTSDIDSVTLLNCTNTSSSESSTGAVLEFSHPAIGCSSSGFTILLNSSLEWSQITFKINMTGTTACWAFSQGTSYVPTDANILNWDSSIDRVFFSKNCWELPQYTLKMNACDNNSDNFFHPGFHTGSFKEFYTTRRRNNLGAAAGLSHGRACLGAGTTIISDIRIW